MSHDCFIIGFAVYHFGIVLNIAVYVKRYVTVDYNDEMHRSSMTYRLKCSKICCNYLYVCRVQSFQDL